MRSRSLLTQVLTINVLLIVATGLLATIAVNASASNLVKGGELLVLGLALAATVLGNWLLLRRRFKPLDDLIGSMEAVDLSSPRMPGTPSRRADSSEVYRLQNAFDRMIARLEAQRREAGRAAIQAQEQERRRIGQDLHDEVNQALTAVSLRLQASIERAPPELHRELIETKRLSSQAMGELLAIARRLRPALLDDHGLLPALGLSGMRERALLVGGRLSLFSAPGEGPRVEMTIDR
jgi:two-component system sensor histidine kinase UhpB